MPLFSAVRLITLLLALFFHAAASFPTELPRQNIRTPIKQHYVSLPTTSTLLFAKKQGGDGSGNAVALIHSHHLLDHKPDNMILKGGKFKLRGVGCLGRPGVALCIGPQKSIDKFRSKLKSAMPQKKFGSTSIDVSSIPAEELEKMSDFEEATLGELRGLLASLGHEDEFFTLTGIDPSIASSSDKGESENNNKNTGKKKRKR